MEKDIPIEVIRQLFRYEPETGHVWRVQFIQNARMDQPVGTLHPEGYLRVNVNFGGKRHGLAVHRIAFALQNGRWPEDLLDHRRGGGTNNTWTNIREANPLQNAHNRRKNRDNTSGFRGVSWHRPLGKWRAQIQINSRPRHLGYFSDIVEAAEAYKAAALRRDAEFARID